MDNTVNMLRDKVKELFAQNRVDVVIGYENGSLPLVIRPCFIQNPEDVEKLIFNSFCSINLAVYLPGLFQMRKKDQKFPRVGIVARGCDARSVIGLIIETQVPRENVIIIGMPCGGMADNEKIQAIVGDEIVSCQQDTNTITIATKQGEEKTISLQENMVESCAECSLPVFESADVKIEGQGKAVSTEKYTRVKEFEAKTTGERWEYFRNEISRCIRCNACRQSCPNCYCKVCFVDQTKPRWVGAGDDLTDIMTYHMGRIFHQAGRCVGCDACVRACPQNIDLRLFTQKLVKDVEELYSFVPGVSEEAVPPLCAFTQDDTQHFITEPSD